MLTFTTPSARPFLDQVHFMETLHALSGRVVGTYLPPHMETVALVRAQDEGVGKQRGV